MSSEKVKELEICKMQKKKLALLTRKNNKKIAELEQYIRQTMERKDQPVGKLGETVFYIKEKPVKIPKTKSEKESSIKEILLEHGVSDVDAILEQLNNAQKGDTQLVKKLCTEKLDTYIKKRRKNEKK